MSGETPDGRSSLRRAVRRDRGGASPLGRLLVARQLAVDPPVRLLHVLEDDVDLVGGRLADLHHRVGDRGGDLALLLVGAPCVPLDRDVRHGLSPPHGGSVVSLRGSDYRSGPSAGQGGYPRSGTITRRACL